MPKIREADCCYNCQEFLCEIWSCWGFCAKHKDFEEVHWHQICDDFEKRTSELRYCRNGKEDGSLS